MTRIGIWFPGSKQKKLERKEKTISHVFLERPFQVRVRLPFQKRSLDYYEWPHVWRVDLMTEDIFGKESCLRAWWFDDKQTAYNFFADEYWYDMQFMHNIFPVLRYEGAAPRYDHLRDECWDIMSLTRQAWQAYKDSGYEDESLLTIEGKECGNGD